ncbi:hypothetical protein OGAPHI_005813 [Ogataea philodendri]|uniref:Uncharacterized protein n=1 Tax=Ogataea philodendri TaxID=1378263 RepID=A0A9P8P0B6_9ASCO|nr:uncharacterized protein OGAPHI_005813 [Ogataea philodendri]KAH3662561.1 hypothetical protein OGAPHI_005813 [Ogataea philodendri]
MLYVAVATARDPTLYEMREIHAARIAWATSATTNGKMKMLDIPVLILFSLIRWLNPTTSGRLIRNQNWPGMASTFDRNVEYPMFLRIKEMYWDTGWNGMKAMIPWISNGQ